MIVRDAVEADVPHIIEGIKHFVSASSYRSDAVDVEHVAHTLKALLSSHDGLVAVMESDNGEFAGCFVGMAHPHLFSAERIFGELFIYTTTKARGHGNKLRRFAEEWARDAGCSSFLIAHPMSEGHLEKVYRRWGFEPHEVHFRKEL